MQHLRLSLFAAAVGQEFALAIGGGTVPVTLVDAQPLPVNPFPGMTRAPFSLIFKAAGPVILPQRVYRLRFGVGGVVEMLLVPIGREGGGVLYQAVFN